MNSLEQQITDAVNKYANTAPIAPEHRSEIIAAMLSGMSLLCYCQVANDGNPKITPHKLNAAVQAVAAQMNLSKDKIRPS
jgi:hypothetical protein